MRYRHLLIGATAFALGVFFAGAPIDKAFAADPASGGIFGKNPMAPSANRFKCMCFKIDGCSPSGAFKKRIKTNADSLAKYLGAEGAKDVQANTARAVYSLDHDWICSETALFIVK